MQCSRWAGIRTQIDRHTEQLEEFDVEGLLAFAERILPRAADMWVQSSLDQKQRLQRLFSPRASRSTESDSIEPP